MGGLPVPGRGEVLVDDDVGDDDDLGDDDDDGNGAAVMDFSVLLTVIGLLASSACLSSTCAFTFSPLFFASSPRIIASSMVLTTL